ncbi:flippase [Pseudomonas urmiensis]|uniref:flippase n=1 Tax=Pseudomonas urmiensis TaxID=2745493 RepID=UPI003D1447BD
MLKFLPFSIGPQVQKYLLNSTWMLVEQCLRLISGVFVGIYIARYLGPEQYGVISYALAISAFALAVSRLGMDAVLVRELVTSKARTNTLMGTAFWMMFTAATFCYMLMVLSVFLSSEQSQVKLYIYIISSSVFFATSLVGDYYFQSRVQAKFSTMCKVAALAVMSIVKLILVFLSADVYYFVLAALADHALLAVFLVIALKRKYNFEFLTCFSWPDARSMLSSVWPMVLTAVASLIYMRIDQVMIRNMLGMYEVGLYSAAVRIYEAWIVLPYVITVSLIPVVVKLRQGDFSTYQLRLVQLFRLVIGLSVVAAVVVSLVGERLMIFAFGSSYSEAAPVLSIVMWSAVFASIGSVSARYFNVERMERKIAFRTLFAAGLNILLNFILIPRYGISGAAIATLICTFIANYVMDWFDRDLTVLLNIKHRAMFWIPLKRGSYE